MSDEIKAPIIIQDELTFAIWAEVMREASQQGIETNISKWDLVYMVEERLGKPIPPSIVEKKETVMNSLIEKHVRRAKGEDDG